MSAPENTEHFIEAVQERIDYFRKEYHLTYAEAIGALEIIKMSLYEEMCDA
jgi:hypothetical protein